MPPPALLQDARRLLDALEETAVPALATDAAGWAAQAVRVGFAVPMPEPPVLPPLPPPPTFAEPPREDDDAYGVELTLMDKLLASRRIKKQQAALHHFERDRKAWNEDRQHALAVYELAQKKQARHRLDGETAYEDALGTWKRALEDFLRTLLAEAESPDAPPSFPAGWVRMTGRRRTLQGCPVHHRRQPCAARSRPPSPCCSLF